MPSSRERDLSVEKLAEVCGVDIASLDGQSRGQMNRALALMREASPDLADAELAMVIESKAASYLKVMGDALLTPTALAKHWAQLEGLVAQQQAQRQATADRTNVPVDPSNCTTCGGHRMVLVFYRPPAGPSLLQEELRSKKHPHMGLPHPDHRRPQDGFEEWDPCPSCNPEALGIAIEYRRKFNRLHPPRPRGRVSSSNARSREEQ